MLLKAAQRRLQLRPLRCYDRGGRWQTAALAAIVKWRAILLTWETLTSTINICFTPEAPSSGHERYKQSAPRLLLRFLGRAQQRDTSWDKQMTSYFWVSATKSVFSVSTHCVLLSWMHWCSYCANGHWLSWQHMEEMKSCCLSRGENLSNIITIE